MNTRGVFSGEFHREDRARETARAVAHFSDPTPAWALGERTKRRPESGMGVG